MRLTSTLMTLTAVALATAAPASAQNIGELVTTGAGDVRAVRAIPLTIDGGLTVEFRGDAAAGCGLTGVCGLSGTVTWTPQRRGELFAVEYLARGRRRFSATLRAGERTVTTTQVSRAAPDGSVGRCSDMRRGDSGTAVAGGGAGGAVRLTFPGTTAIESLGADALTTRCGGPLQLDLRGALPTATLSRRFLRRGRTSLDLHSSRPFSAAGFTGTVRSTITVRAGRPKGEELSRSRRGRERGHVLEARYAIERIEGGLSTTLAGSGDPAVCAPLDACGVTGTIASSFGAVRNGELQVTAVADGRRRPWRDLRAALDGKRVRDVLVVGFGAWEGGPESATTASVLHPGGGPPCTDRVAVPAGALFILPAPGGLHAELSNDPDALRTRCPGPRSPDVLPDPADGLATGPILPRALAGPRPTLRLTRDTPFNGSYIGRTRADITFRLRRISIRRETVVG